MNRRELSTQGHHFKITRDPKRQRIRLFSSQTSSAPNDISKVLQSHVEQKTYRYGSHIVSHIFEN